MSIFGELDHRLSVVKRWGILHTIQQQSVAEHIFNVERMAVRIAKQWFGWDDKGLWRVAKAAHHHDDLESLSGDFPSMVKPYFKEDEFVTEHAHLVPDPTIYDTSVRAIVKLADLLDAYRFLSMEYKLGNRYVDNHHTDYKIRITEHVKANWPDQDDVLVSVSMLMRDFDNETSTRHGMRGR